MKENLFPIGTMVTWVADVPPTWRFTVTPGPMEVVGGWWNDGTPSEYALRFGENGMEIPPGWILTVKYDADSTDYYDPPRSILFGKSRLVTQVHEKWLIPFSK